LAEFGITIKVFYLMIVNMSNGIGRTDIGTREAGDAVIGVLDHTESLLFVQFENFGRADVDTQFTSATRLFVNSYFK
jgi:hypothetical protein